MMKRDISAKELDRIFHSYMPKAEGSYAYSSVMILLFQKNAGLHVLFTQRSLQMKRQPGDICFPGGRREAKETALETAYREVWEELGIERSAIQLCGQPDFVITTQGAAITPFIGLLEKETVEKIQWNRDEVEKIITIPLSYFMHIEPEEHYLLYEPSLSDGFPVHSIQNGAKYPFSKFKIKQFFYHYQGEVIWGLTARILHNFIKRLRQGLNSID